VPGFPDFYNIIHDSELDSEGNIKDNTDIYTYTYFQIKKIKIR
jgi:hypothetical protein